MRQGAHSKSPASFQFCANALSLLPLHRSGTFPGTPEQNRLSQSWLLAFWLFCFSLLQPILQRAFMRMLPGGYLW